LIVIITYGRKLRKRDQNFEKAASWIEREVLTGTNKIHRMHLRLTVFFLNNQPDALFIKIYCYKTLQVSGNLTAHHQEFPTVHSVLVSFMQEFDDRFQAELGWNWNCFNSSLTLLGSGRPNPV